MSDTQFKSRFRGVYRCGKRWKAQYQEHSIQYYLGTHDTEEEASAAYEKRVRSISRNPVLGDDTNHRLADADMKNNDVLLGGTLESPGGLDLPASKRAKTEASSSNNYFSTDFATSFQAKLIWERLITVYQRLILARAVQEKMHGAQTTMGDQQRQSMLKALHDEIILLDTVKGQLEEAMFRYFINEVALKEQSGGDHDEPPTFDLADPLPPTHLATPLMQPNAVDLPPVQEDSLLGLSAQGIIRAPTDHRMLSFTDSLGPTLSSAAAALASAVTGYQAPSISSLPKPSLSSSAGPVGLTSPPAITASASSATASAGPFSSSGPSKSSSSS